MKINRVAHHLLGTFGLVKRAFPRHTLNAIEKAIKQSETVHTGEIRFAVEGGLDGLALFGGQTPRDRAIELFSQMRIWDTEHNNGLLIYLMLADRAVEIVADRGIHAKVSAHEWKAVCRQMEAAFGRADYEAGVVAGVGAVAQHLARHFPAVGANLNELADKPLVL